MKFLSDFNNLFLIAVALVSGSMLLWPMLTRRAAGPSLGTLQATQLMNHKNAVLLDVREAEEFARGHVAQAKNIPFAGLAGRFGELGTNKSKPVIVVCERGSRSGKAAAQLRAQGFAEVYTLAGGMQAWQQAGLPVKK